MQLTASRGKLLSRRLVGRLMRCLPDALLPLAARLPRIGKFAEALHLHRHPFRMRLPQQGQVLPSAPAVGDSARIPSPRPLYAVLRTRHADWSGRRAALLAHWDANGRIAPYVRHYASSLIEEGFAVALVTGSRLHLVKEDAVFDAVIYRKGPGYDFTSWKAALAAFPSLYAARTLLLTNDSVFAPVGSLRALLRDMREVDCDFWGVLESHAPRPHLQSYWLVFRQAALHHPAFRAFWAHVPASDAKDAAIAQELRLLGWLQGHGLHGAARIPRDVLTPTALNPSHYAWDSLLSTGVFPFLKRELLTKNPYEVPLCSWREKARQMGYPVQLIDECIQGA